MATRRLLPLALVALSGGCAAQASLLDVIFYDNRFGSIDSTTGTYSQVSALPIDKAAGIAQSNGSVYVEDLADNLLLVDPVTGASHVVGNTGLALNFVVFAGGNTGLYGIDYNSDLFSFNPQTGSATLIGHTGLAPNNGQDDTSLSFDGTSLFYTAGKPGANDELYQISITTGMATDLGSAGVTGIAGSAFANGNLDLFQYGQSTNYLYSAGDGSTDFTKGPALNTQIIDGGIPASSTVPAATAPEPATLVMAGSALVGIWFFSRRRLRNSEPAAFPNRDK